MANMTFKASLLPNSQTFGYSLGSETNKWKIYGDQHQEFDYLEASSEYTIPSYIIKLINDGYRSGWFGCMNASGKGCPTSTGDLWYNIHWERTKIGNRIYLEANPYGVNKLYKGSCWANNETSMPVWEEILSKTGADEEYVNVTGDTMTGQLNNTFGGSSTARHYENVAFYENNASSYTGTIKIKLPNTTSNMVMMVLKIIIFDYNSNSGCELLVSGYTYNDKKWYNAAASPQGTFTKGIRLAYDGTNFCVLLGTTSSTWNYSKIILADVYSGYNAQPATGYAISLITSESGYTISQTLTSLLRADKVWGAVWNDYAEMREVPKEIEPGRCVREVGDDTMVLSTARLQRGCKIISDTFGFNIGETETAKTPIAVSGRALVYLAEDRETARSHIGWPVCSGPDGTVSIMTEEEEEKYPSRIVGTISSVPDYEEWGTGKVKVNGRIWIYVR